MLQILLVIGGWTGYESLDSTELFDPNHGSWVIGAVLPSPMRSMSAATIDNRVFIFGNDTLY